jgi:hypothetical protein
MPVSFQIFGNTAMCTTDKIIALVSLKFYREKKMNGMWHE